MNEDEHIKLVDVGNHFYDKLSELIAQHVAQLPKEIEMESLIHMHELSSVFGSRYIKYLSKFRKQYKTEVANRK